MLEALFTSGIVNLVVTSRIWLLFLLLLPGYQSHAAATLGAQPPVITIDQETSILTPDQRLRYWIETDPINIEQLLAADLPWQNASHNTLNLHQEKRPVWVQLRLQSRTSDYRRLLHLDWSLLRQVEFYLFDRTDNRLLRYEYLQPGNASESGARLPFYIEMTLPHLHSVDVFLRVQASEYFLLPITVFSPTAYVEHKQNRYLGYGLFFGLLLAMLGYNLSLYIFIRDPNYAIYCLYVAAITAYSATMTGVGPAWIWGDWEWLTEHAYRIFSSLSFITAALFIRQFLNLREYGSWPLPLSTFAISSWAGLLLLSPILEQPLIGWLHTLTALISPIIAFIITLPLLLQRDAQARNLSIAWLPLLIATFYFMLHLVGLLDYSHDVMNLQRWGFAIEVLLLSIALAERINRERRDRVLAQEASLRYYRQASVARQGELAARESMLKAERDARAELEQRVAERTHELQTALTALANLNQELEAQSRTDGLTQLANRRYFDDCLLKEHNRALRQQTPLALLIGDLDHFKQLNDRYGHLAGDECLRQAASLWRQQARRAHEIAARYGGEELVMLLPGVTQQDALWLAECIRAGIEALRIEHEGEQIRFTCSIGVCVQIPSDNTTADSLIEAADDALYQAKENGRNRVCVGIPPR